VVTVIDIIVITDKPGVSAYAVYKAISPDFQEPVRSVTTLDKTTGLTSTFRDAEIYPETEERSKI
jgi:hypothetical protein